MTSITSEGDASEPLIKGQIGVEKGLKMEASSRAKRVQNELLSALGSIPFEYGHSNFSQIGCRNLMFTTLKGAKIKEKHRHAPDTANLHEELRSIVSDVCEHSCSRRVARSVMEEHSAG